MNIHFLEFHYGLKDVLAEECPEFLLGLLSKFRIVAHNLKEKLFSDCHAVHFGVSDVDESLAFLVHDLEATDNCSRTILPSQKNFIINLVADVIFSFFYEKDFETFLHFVVNYLIRDELSDFQ